MIMRHIKNCKRPRISQIVKKESWVLHKVPTLEFLKDCLNLWFLSFSASKAKYRYLITSPFSPFHSRNWEYELHSIVLLFLHFVLILFPSTSNMISKVLFSSFRLWIIASASWFPYYISFLRSHCFMPWLQLSYWQIQGLLMLSRSLHRFLYYTHEKIGLCNVIFYYLTIWNWITGYDIKLKIVIE